MVRSCSLLMALALATLFSASSVFSVAVLFSACPVSFAAISRYRTFAKIRVCRDAEWPWLVSSSVTSESVYG